MGPSSDDPSTDGETLEPQKYAFAERTGYPVCTGIGKAKNDGFVEIRQKPNRTISRKRGERPL